MCLKLDAFNYLLYFHRNIQVEIHVPNQRGTINKYNLTYYFHSKNSLYTIFISLIILVILTSEISYAFKTIKELDLVLLLSSLFGQQFPNNFNDALMALRHLGFFFGTSKCFQNMFEDNLIQSFSER